MPTYGPGVRKGDRLQVSVVAYDSDGGGAEVFWSRSADILTMDHEGSVNLLEDGSLHMRMRRDDDEPLVLSVYGNRIVVRHTEDMEEGPPDELHSSPVVFDSNLLDLGVAPPTVPSYVVGVTDPPLRLRTFDTEDEANAFHDALEGAADGIYYVEPTIPPED